MNRMKRASIVCVLLALSVISRAGDYEKAWEALHHNDKTHAYEYFRKSLKSDPAHKSNAIAALILLDSYEMKTNFLKNNPNPLDIFTDPNPYTYALWFTDGVFGTYGKKDGEQMANINRVQTDPRYNGSIHAAANYFKGVSYVQGLQNAEAKPFFDNMSALENWQMVGPFDNISGSGFNKDYGPVKEPNKGKGFLSYKNTMVDWFTPVYGPTQGWVYVKASFPASSGVGYAQTFVNSPDDQDVMLCTGAGGSLKVWVNDKLMISEEEELNTELDQFNVPCHLKKGYNRILVQIGFTGDNESPNFIVRLTDNKMEALKGLSSTSDVQQYTVDNSTTVPQVQPHFAEIFFKDKVAKTPQDPMNAFLLSKVYLRNEEFDKAKESMYALYQKYPDDPLILYQYYLCLSSSYDETARTELAEKIKTVDPDNYQVLQENIGQLEKEKKYAEALEVVHKLEQRNGPSVWLYSKQIGLYSKMQKVDSMVAALKEGYDKYPESASMVGGMYAYYTRMLRSPMEGLKVLDKYVNSRLDVDEMGDLADAYFEQNEKEKGIATLQKILASAVNSPSRYQPLVRHYYSAQEYDSAIHYLQIEHQLSPYNHNPLGDIASCYFQKGDKTDALSYYRQALAQYPSVESYREKIREIEGKPDVFSYFPKLDAYAEINKALKGPKDTSTSFSFIFNDSKVVLYSEGSNENVVSVAVYVNNKDGVEFCKELTVPYNSVYQDMTIIKAEVVKKNGSKVPAETDDNQMVFTNLEPGDVVYYTYKVSSFAIGRLGREFWDKFYFSYYVPAKLVRYSIMVADQLPLNYEVTNADLKPVQSQHENFRMYTWEMKDLLATKQEAYSPEIEDIGTMLHVSTVKSWDVIAEWYSDITRIQSKEDFEIEKAFKEIFPGNSLAGLSDHEKARRIYNYIEENVVYSSVSFRQGAYVPQRASKTLVTKLGDCKDLSTLFLSFARKAGLDANLVLVSTRDNGQKAMLLPSMEFNHCIIRFKDGADYHYVELTNNQLCFESMPQSLVDAQVLDIPYTYNTKEQVQLLQPVGNTESARHRVVKATVDNADLHINTTLITTGELASDTRGRYAGKSKDDTKDAVQQSVSQYYKNTADLESYSFANLDDLTDSVHHTDVYTVKNEVISVGDFSMLRIPLHEAVASMNIFTNEARKYPFEYWKYENSGLYDTEVELNLPSGKAFDQVPSDLDLSFKNMKYKLTYQKIAPNKLVVKRVFETSTRANIEPADFDKMKDFFNAIVTAEQKYVSFK
jgi:tetratricopeptide (TPR) repeat protein/transglutaminase-like putative cysteine protease